MSETAKIRFRTSFGEHAAPKSRLKYTTAKDVRIPDLIISNLKSSLSEKGVLNIDYLIENAISENCYF